MADKSGDGEGFLSRWSRRKREEEPETDKAEGGAIQEDEPLVGDELAELEEDEEAEENRLVAEAVDIDALTYEDDFKIFMKRGVPGPLRQQALRKLWRTNPVLANLDGLNDYEQDFNDPKMNVYKSIWQAGRGFLTELEQQAQQASGRITAAYEDEETEEDAIAEAEAEDVTDEAADELPEAEPGAEGGIPIEVAADEAEPLDAEQYDEPEDEGPAEPRRVSYRRRWEV